MTDPLMITSRQNPVIKDLYRISSAVDCAHPFGSKLSNLIPFLSEAGVGNITYRQRLFENSQIVIAKNPWFGSVNYLDTAEMEVMRQGQGRALSM